VKPRVVAFAFMSPSGLSGKPSGLRRRFSRATGFSLIEVVLALAVMASTLLVVLGLLGVGMAAFHQAKATSVSAQIAQQIFSQIEVTPFYTVVGQTSPTTPAPTSPTYINLPNPNTSVGGNIRYFDDQGNELTGATATVNGVVVPAIYWANVRVITVTPLLQASASATPSYNSSLATVTIQVAYNPGGLKPTANSVGLWDGTTSSANTILPIYNFDSFLAQGN
jgi:uncharacterized protein (TIGR02598 family)